MKRSVSEHNREMWERLAEAGYAYTKPQGRLPSSESGLRRYVDPHGVLNDTAIKGARVLVLAGGGGWHPVIFAKLGAKVTCLDISPKQLETVAGLARKKGVEVTIEEGDMADLSRFRPSSFQVVWHVHSLVFTEDPERVFREVGRILATNGIYRTETMHPFGFRMYEGWTGTGWTMRTPYHDRGPVEFSDPFWDDGNVRVEAPTLEYGHTIERIVNGIVAAGMVVDGLWEYTPDPVLDPEPGTDEHVEATFPIFVEVSARKLPTRR